MPCYRDGSMSYYMNATITCFRDCIMGDYRNGSIAYDKGW